jgi:lysophospholipase L1-like esterase
MTRTLRLSLAALALGTFLAASAAAQSPQQFAPDATRYMALGDSIAAGYKAMPVTEGYAYRLYQDGVFDRIPHALFNNISVVGTTSSDVLAYQVPQAVIPFAIGGFNPGYITLTVGGNDLLKILAFAQTEPDQAKVYAYALTVLNTYGQNLYFILDGLKSGLPDAKIFVANQYPLPEIEAALPVATSIIAAFNETTATVVSLYYGNGVYLVDVHSAFLGQNNLVEGGRGKTSIFEVHPTNVGHRVMEKAFAAVIAANK